MTKDELNKLYGEALFEAEKWNARANEAKRQLIELYNQEQAAFKDGAIKNGVHKTEN